MEIPNWISGQGWVLVFWRLLTAGRASEVRHLFYLLFVTSVSFEVGSVFQRDGSYCYGYFSLSWGRQQVCCILVSSSSKKCY